jgi:hypothetical protein
MTFIYLVLENQYGPPPTWTDKSKAFLNRTDAIRYFHDVMVSDEVRSGFVPRSSASEINPDNPYENWMLVIKEVWLEG